jgi:transglutaminase-like putative cysteine protease
VSSKISACSSSPMRENMRQLKLFVARIDRAVTTTDQLSRLAKDCRSRADLKPKPNARYRTIPESKIIDVLLFVSWAIEVDAGDCDFARIATSHALELWITKGLGYQFDSDGTRLFDPAEVINYMKWLGVTGQDRHWQDHFVKTHRAFVAEFLPEEIESGVSDNYPPTRFSMKLRRSFDLQHFAESASVRLRAPLPLAGAYLEDLEITPVILGGSQSDVVIREQCLETRLKVPAERAITIGGDFIFTAINPTRLAEALTPREHELYLRKSEGLIQVTPNIEYVASALAKDCASTQQSVEAFWSYMVDTLFSGIIHYSDLPANAPGEWVLDNGWYDCQLGAALLVSLCRARGIPARIVSGHLLYRVQPISHYWAEVWFNEIGWRPFDLICWDLSTAGQDQGWRNLFAGQIDYRAVTQCFPLAFTGPMSVRFSEAWHMIQVGAPQGVDIAFTDVADGSLIFRDKVLVENLGPV